MSTSIAIGNIEIHQDKNGRYSLNDLYRASGGNPNHRPSNWIRTKQTQALISELKYERRNIGYDLISEQEFLLRSSRVLGGNSRPEIEPIITISTGSPTTFVVKELVYAYAMWVSPEFNLKVIRAYDALVRGEIAKAKQKQNDATIKQWKTERAYFEKYPRDKEILRCVLIGEPYWLIAEHVKCHASTVANAVKRLLAWGLLELNKLKSARLGSNQSKAYRDLKKALSVKVRILKKSQYLIRIKL